MYLINQNISLWHYRFPMVQRTNPLSQKLNILRKKLSIWDPGSNGPFSLYIFQEFVYIILPIGETSFKHHSSVFSQCPLILGIHWNYEGKLRSMLRQHPNSMKVSNILQMQNLSNRYDLKIIVLRKIDFFPFS